MFDGSLCELSNCHQKKKQKQQLGKQSKKSPYFLLNDNMTFFQKSVELNSNTTGIVRFSFDFLVIHHHKGQSSKV